MNDNQYIYSFFGSEKLLDTAAAASLKDIIMNTLYDPAIEIKNGNLKVSSFATIFQYSDFMRTGRKQYILNADL